MIGRERKTLLILANQNPASQFPKKSTDFQKFDRFHTLEIFPEIFFL